jgi:hypothetical protein
MREGESDSRMKELVLTRVALRVNSSKVEGVYKDNLQGSGGKGRNKENEKGYLKACASIRPKRAKSPSRWPNSHCQPIYLTAGPTTPAHYVTHIEP